MPKCNQPRKTWKYDHEFKVGAVQLSYVEGLSVTELANSLLVNVERTCREILNTKRKTVK